MWGFFVRMTRPVVRHLPLMLMAWGFAFSIFVFGVLVGNLHWYPFDPLWDALRTAEVGWGKLVRGDRMRAVGSPSDVLPTEVSKRRIVAKHPVDDGAAFLLTGGEGQFLDYCPQHGCAAVILKRDGTLVHAYPYRPEELSAKRTIDLPYGEILHDDAKDTAIVGLAPLPNGDLVAVYDLDGATPYGGGVARIDKDGHIVWYRRDYSDHWPKVTEQNEILVISHKIGPGQIRIPLTKGARVHTFTCSRGIVLDEIHILDANGQVKEEIPVFDALFASPYQSRLLSTIDPAYPEVERCDPIHTNSVVPVGPELAARFNDVKADDLLLSLRNVSALAIIGRADHALKHLFVGTFIFQHSAQVAPGGKIVLFDNFGGSEQGGPSRVLLYDPITHEEQTVFPNHHTPKDLTTFSRFNGNIDVSQDGTRALFVVALAGKGYEIGLPGGEILTTFNNFHDVHALTRFANTGNKVRYFTEYGVYYVSPNLTN